MSLPFSFISEDAMTELSNASNKAFLLQRTEGFGSKRLTGTRQTGRLGDITIDAGGTQYAVNDVITVTGGGGSGVTIVVAAVNASGAITSFTYTSRGNGFTSVPTLGVTSTNGSGAQLTATLETVAKWSKAVNSDTVLKLNTGGDIPGIQPQIARVGVALGGTVVDLELLKGGADMPKPAQGSYTVQGDLIINATTRNGNELILRNVSQDRNPSAVYAGGGAFPASHTVVAAVNANNAKGSHTVVAIPNSIEYEVDPTVTLSSSPAIATGKLEGIVTLTGPDRNDVVITRVARFTAADITAGTLSKKVGSYFKNITAVSSENFSAGQVAVTVEDKATKLTLTPYDSAIVDYIDLGLDIGNLVPFSFYGGVANGVGFNFTRDEAVQYTLGMLFGEVGIRQNFQDGSSPLVLPTGIENAVTEVFVGTQCEVEIAGVKLPLNSAELNMSQSYVPGPYIGKTLWPKKPRRSGYRTCQLNLSFPATQENNWLQYYAAHADFLDVTVRALDGVTGTQGKFGGKHEWKFKRMVLSETPGMDTAGQDVAGQSATLRPYSNDTNAAYSIEIVQDDYEEKLFRYA